MKHEFSFIDESNGSTLPNSYLAPSLFFKDSPHLIEEKNFNLVKLIINSIVLTNNICFSSNAGKTYSYSNTWKNKASISVALTLNKADFPPLTQLIHAHKCKRTSYSNNCDPDLCETHGSNYVSSTRKPVSTKAVSKSVHVVSCNKPVIFYPDYNSLHASKIFIDKTVRCSVNGKPMVFSSLAILLNHLLRGKLYILIVLIWLKSLTLPVTVYLLVLNIQWMLIHLSWSFP